MKSRTNRRDFLKSTALVGAGFWIAGREAMAEDSKSPNERLNFACIGVGGKGDSDSEHVSTLGNVLAICDIDDHTLDHRAKKPAFEKAKKYNDFRKMFDEMAKDIDAVTVSTPDHCHAVAAMMAIKHGKHVYCQKPLTHTVVEARALREAARQYKVKTQMGNQGTAANGLRRGVEIVQSGAIGPVREIHVWTNRPIWDQAPKVMARPTDSPPIPPNVHWDLFLGPVAERPYNPCYAPFKWRGWWDFGTGALGDMGCHTANLAFMANKLEYPTSIIAEAGDVNPETCPSWASVTYEFPARGDLPPLKFFWYEGRKPDGKRSLPPDELVEKVLRKPAEGKKRETLSDSGLIIVGDDGILYSPNDYGSDFRLFPEEKFHDFKDPTRTLPRIMEEADKRDLDLVHKLDWVNAIKNDGKAMSNFDYAGLLSETILLGNVAIRAGNGIPTKLLWDGPGCRITNETGANRFLKIDYREGWTL